MRQCGNCWRRSWCTAAVLKIDTALLYRMMLGPLIMLLSLHHFNRSEGTKPLRPITNQETIEWWLNFAQALVLILIDIPRTSSLMTCPKQFRCIFLQPPTSAIHWNEASPCISRSTHTSEKWATRYLRTHIWSPGNQTLALTAQHVCKLWGLDLHVDVTYHMSRAFPGSFRLSALSYLGTRLKDKVACNLRSVPAYRNLHTSSRPNMLALRSIDGRRINDQYAMFRHHQANIAQIG